MDLAPAIGMGIGAMCCAMLRLPLTSILLATLLLGGDGLRITPQVIVAVVVAYVVITSCSRSRAGGRRGARSS